jgi:hypothetical protein
MPEKQYLVVKIHADENNYIIDIEIEKSKMKPLIEKLLGTGGATLAAAVAKATKPPPTGME